jgi:hypothetical protein
LSFFQVLTRVVEKHTFFNASNLLEKISDPDQGRSMDPTGFRTPDTLAADQQMCIPDPDMLSVSFGSTSEFESSF